MTTPHSMSWAVLRDVLQRSTSWPARLRARSANSRYGAPGAKPRYTGVVAAAGFLAGVAWARPVAGASSATSPRGIKRMAQYKDPKRNRPGVLSPGLDRREVNEHVRTRLLRDKAKALRVVEPLHLTLCHTVSTSALRGTAPEMLRPWSPRPETGSNKNRETSGPRGAQTNR